MEVTREDLRGVPRRRVLLQGSWLVSVLHDAAVDTRVHLESVSPRVACRVSQHHVGLFGIVEFPFQACLSIAFRQYLVSFSGTRPSAQQQGLDARLDLHR